MQDPARTLRVFLWALVCVCVVVHMPRMQAYFYMAECFAAVDLSLMVKSGVQYSLWGGSVLNLGTEQHRRKYFDDIACFKLPGCFAMTELKHGGYTHTHT